MHPLVQVIIAVSSVVSAVCLCGILKVLLQIRSTRGLPEQTIRFDPHSCCLTGVDSHAGYGVFMFRDGAWKLQADLSTAGFEVTPPTIPGRFDGQVIRREAQRSL